MNRSTTWMALALCALVLTQGPGCGAPTPVDHTRADGPGNGPKNAAPTPRTASKTAAIAEASKTYKLVGVVRHVNPETGLVTIRHEAIPGFMEAMTMPFTVKDRKLLEDVRTGDEVEGELRVEREGGEVKDYELTDLVVTRPAPAQALSLNLSGGRPELKAVPQALQPGDAVPDFTMTDEDGKPLKLSDLRGKVVALTFIYTRCPLPDFCPRMDRKFAALAERVAAVPGRSERIRLLSISFDPEHDTPEVLKKHARAQGAKPPLWTFAVATHDELFKVANPLGLTYGPGRDEIIHNLTTAVIDADGRLVRLETGAAARSWDTADMLKTIYAQVSRTKG
jgi:protein SCO1